MNWLQSILYALISGFSEFMPISSHAHKAIVLRLFGVAAEPPLLGLMIHIGMALALFYATRSQISRLYREYRLLQIPRHRRRRQPDRQSVFDISLLKVAVIPLVLSFLVYARTQSWRNELYLVAIFLAINGLILHFPMYLPRGNKDAQNISRLDALLLGVGGGLSVLPGISRVGTSSSIAIARGADMQQALKWALMLSFPALAGYMCFDIYGIIAGGFAGLDFVMFLQGILCGAFAFAGASMAIALARFVAVRIGFTGFSYYSWGAALFAFILYMTI